MAIKQTAGRDSLGDFAPEFAHFNDDVLFGENWNAPGIDHKTRCIITVVALEVPGEETSNQWCEPVTDEDYHSLTDL